MRRFCQGLSGLLFGSALIVGAGALSGCHSAVPPASIPDNSGPDPADANLSPVADDQPAVAPVSATPALTRVAATPQQSAPQPYSNDYPSQQVAPQSAPAPQYPDQNGSAAPPYPDSQGYPDGENDNYNAPGYASGTDQEDAGQPPIEEADQPPPPLPDYEQPEAPAPNYLWNPGYWGWANAGFFWVPGIWCAPPFYGALWTPPYWGFYGNRYFLHRGYWGQHVGFYGGVPYGFGYTGVGYHGGYWNGRNFYYNRAVNRIDTTNIRNVYNRTVIVNNNTRVSYNGGRGGIAYRPQAAELAAMRAPRVPPMATQVQVRQQAAQNRAQFYNQNRGRPAIVAAARPVLADRVLQRPAPVVQNRPVQPANRPGGAAQPQTRPIQPQTRPTQPQISPTQPQTRPMPTGNRPGQPAVQPGSPQTRPIQPQVQPARPVQNQQRPQPQPRPVQQQNRPVRPPQPTQSRPQPRPQSQLRPAPQIQQRPVTQPQPQFRPAPQPQSRPRPQPQPQMRSAPQSAPSARPGPR